MMTRLLKYLLLITSLSLMSCGTVQRVAVSTTGSMLFKAAPAMETDGNWEHFKTSTLPNLKFAEGLLYLRPENRELLVTLAKGYSGYAFAVNETLFLADQYEDKDSSVHRTNGILNYSKALRFGIRFFETYGITYKLLVKAARDKLGVSGYLDSKLSDDKVSLEGALFTAFSLSGLINFQKTNLKMIAQLSIAKGIFDWVCSKNPDINFGTCQIFYGAYEASRPRMLGGNPALGKNIFEKLITKYPANWLARIAFMQYYLVPLSDDEGYKQQKYFLNKKTKEFKKALVWDPSEHSAQSLSSRLRLYQAIALKRFNIIKKYEDDLF